MQKLSHLGNTTFGRNKLYALSEYIAPPPSSKTIRKMAESVNHQEVYNLLVSVAKRAGDIISAAQPHVQDSDTKKNSMWTFSLADICWN